MAQTTHLLLLGRTNTPSNYKRCQHLFRRPKSISPTALWFANVLDEYSHNSISTCDLHTFLCACITCTPLTNPIGKLETASEACRDSVHNPQTLLIGNGERKFVCKYLNWKGWKVHSRIDFSGAKVLLLLLGVTSIGAPPMTLELHQNWEEEHGNEDGITYL